MGVITLAGSRQAHLLDESPVKRRLSSLKGGYDMTIDGFPIQQNFDWLPVVPDPAMNQWSYGKVVKIDVVDFYMNPRWVLWKGKKMWVADYEFFVMLLKSWIRPPKTSLYQPEGMTKEAALDLMFEMGEA